MRLVIAWRALLPVLGVAIVLAATETHAAATRTCALLVSEARFELDDLREEERLAPIELTADQAIFELLEPLWKARSTERLRYLAAKHARDRARLSVKEAGIATNRAEAKLEVLKRECASPDADPGEALERFESQGCDLIRRRKEIAAVDLAYRQEVLESTGELRRLELATAQDLIRARYALDLAEAQLRSHTGRLEECRKAVSSRPSETPRSPGN